MEQKRYCLSCEQSGEGLRQPLLVLRTKCPNHSAQEEVSQLIQLSSAPCLERAPQSQIHVLEQLSKKLQQSLKMTPVCVGAECWPATDQERMSTSNELLPTLCTPYTSLRARFTKKGLEDLSCQLVPISLSYVPKLSAHCMTAGSQAPMTTE